MRKIVSSLILCYVICAAFWITSICSDRYYLDQELIRIHIVANSDSESDQDIKLQVRDAICRSVASDLERVQNAEEAFSYLRNNLSKLRNIANQVLEEAGVDMEATISLGKEVFTTREYDTFRLPAGIYKTVRIILGEGNGENWWCVAFPSLCSTETVFQYEEAAACAGMSSLLVDSLKNTPNYELRFWVLDLIGNIAGCFYE